MLEQVKVLTGSTPQQATADAGYFSEANVTDARLGGIDLLVAPDRQKHGSVEPATTGPPPFASPSVAEPDRCLNLYTNVDLVRKITPEVVVLDIVMDGMGGVGAACEIQAIAPE